MSNQDYLSESLNAATKFAQGINSYGKDTMSTGLIYVFTTLGIVVLLKSVISNSKAKQKTNEKDEDFIKQIMIDQLREISKGISKLIEVTNEKNIILSKNIDRIVEVENKIDKLSVKQDTSFRNIHLRVNSMNSDIEAIKISTGLCAK